MATDDRQILVTGIGPTPQSFLIPGNGQITPRAVFAHYDGTSAAGAFLPALKVTSDGGKLVGVYPLVGQTMAAGASAEVSWFPDVGGTTSPAAGLPVTETLFLDTRSTGVTSATVFKTGVSYLVTVQGTYSLFNAALTFGVPEANAMFPTSGGAARVSTQVGRDAETVYADINAGAYPGHQNSFEINLGSGFSHLEPFDGVHTAPVSNHLYTYQLTGQGSAGTFRINDAPLGDNYGQLLITIFGIPGGGGALGAAGGDLSGTYPNPNVAAMHETGGPTKLTLGSIPDGDFLKRSGATVIGAAGGAGTISSITSTGSTITVTAPGGPTTNVDLPASGVTGATYGSSTQTPQIAVNAEGIITSASNVSISGIAGTGLVKLFDSTLGAPAAAIDTGAGGVAGGHGDLIVMYIARTARAANQDNINITFNNDTAANYDKSEMFGGLGGVGVLTSQMVNAAANIAAYVPGANATASYPGVGRMTIPSYDQTTFFKTLELTGGWASQLGAGVEYVTVQSVGTWRNTAAITRIAVTGATGNLVTGSRLVVYGTQ